MVWLQGVNRQRATRPSSKALGGTRLQEAFDAGEDINFALTAMRVDHVPEKVDGVLRGTLTVSPEKSHLSYKAMQDLRTFIVATDESLAMIEKSISPRRLPTRLSRATQFEKLT